EPSHEDAGHEAGDVDPHTWTDPKRYAQQARTVQAAMQHAFPAQAEKIQARADALVSELEELDAAYQAGLATCEVPFIVVNHNAFAYMAERYGFEVASVFGLTPEAESTPGQVKEIMEEAREHNVTLVLREDVASPKTMELVAQEIGARVGVLHPLGSITQAQAEAGEDYLSLMRANLMTLQEAMQCT
ncbi:MAG: zinc ABC transporter substrate-binding protein, partial [Candidatus Thermoplasmatota archaeon]|nr:zinc ABC transporter substrate-binding protein [Candidatus Thermoplasmatota archaeon]